MKFSLPYPQFADSLLHGTAEVYHCLVTKVSTYVLHKIENLLILMSQY